MESRFMGQKRWLRRSGLLLAVVLVACGGIEGDGQGAAPATVTFQTTDNGQGGSILPPLEGESPSLLPGVGALTPTDDSAQPRSHEGESAISHTVVPSGGQGGSSSIRPRDASLSPLPVLVSLGAMADADIQRLEDENRKRSDDGGQRRLRTGLGRKIAPQSAVSPAAAGGALQWRTLGDGSRVAALGVTTPDARSVRLGLRIDALPADARLRFYAPAADSMVELPARHVLARVQAKRESAVVQGGGVFWAPSVAGPTALVEVVLPAGGHTAGVALGIEEVIHQVMDTAEAGAAMTEKRLSPSVSGTCQLDYVCSVPEYDAADASLFLEFIDYDNFGYAYSVSCSGMLISDAARTGAPYVLTADHCISTPALAFDTDAYLFWRSTTCGGSTVDPRLALFAAGLEYLYSENERTGTDMALLRPSNQTYHVPTDGLRLAGWTAATQGAALPVVGLHHPQGDHLMRSLGMTVNSPKRNYLRVVWNQGTTEPGSSGSALLNGAGQVIGTLWGGASACGDRQFAPDDYGRFSVAYSKGLRNWLNTPARPLAMVGRTGHVSGPSELVFSDSRRSPSGRRVLQAARLNTGADALAPSGAWRVPAVLQPLEFGSYRLVTVQDMDGDGKDDVVIRRPGAFGTDSFSVLQEREVAGVATPGEWLLHDRVSRTITVLGMADFDGNGIADLVLYEPRRKLIQLVLFSRNGSGNYVPDLVNLFGLVDSFDRPIPSLTPVAVGDFNGTGRGQILIQNRLAPRMPLFLHWDDAAGDFTASSGELRLTGGLVATPDINGDGRDDFVFSARGVVRYALSQGGGVVGSTYSLAPQATALPSTPTGFVIAAIKDADGDGLPDLVLRHKTTGEIRIARNPGTTATWSIQSVSLLQP